jgi:glucose-6-phosphate 1-epimerase
MKLIPGITWTTGPDGTPALALETPHSNALIALHGATVLSFTPKGAKDLLWVSPFAKAAPGKALRGGVPLCGPWFGPHATVPTAPVHGLMRTQPWTPLRAEALLDGVLRVEFSLDLPPQRALGWPHTAGAFCTVEVGEALSVELTVRNTGATPFMLSGALHTYLAVSDVRNVSVRGLAEREYVDFTAGCVLRRHGAGPVNFTEESARFFLSAAPVTLIDPGWQREVKVSGWGGGATVLWNPWAETATAMADVGERWPEFVCIEAANIPETYVPLAPSCSHHLGTRISL